MTEAGSEGGGSRCSAGAAAADGWMDGGLEENMCILYGIRNGEKQSCNQISVFGAPYYFALYLNDVETMDEIQSFHDFLLIP